MHGYLYAIPAWASAILCVDLDAYWGRRPRTKGPQRPPNQPAGPSNSSSSNDTNVVTLIPLPDGYPTDQQWQWHGAGLNQDKTAIYCIPSNAESVLKVDLTTHRSSLIPIDVNAERYPNYRPTLSNKWYGGILGWDNCVYGVPYRSCAVLCIDCTTDTATLIGPDFGVAGYNWHGGILVQGKIYAHPSHAERTVLVIDTTTRTPPNKDNNATCCFELPIDAKDTTDNGNSHNHDTQTTTTTTTTTQETPPTTLASRYKWLGGSIGADGNIYCPACDTTAVLQINVTTDTCTTFGFTGTDKNKWQGGVLAKDGCIYCIPASGRHVLRIGTVGSSNQNSTPPLQLWGHLPAHKDKWQGGHVGVDGKLYFIPENGYRVLRVTTPLEPPPQLIHHKELPTDDVVLEYL